MQLGEAVSYFLRAQKAKNLSARTLDWYGWVLRSFVEFAGEETPVEAITPQVLREWVTARAEGRSPRGANSFLRGVRVFFRFLHEEEITTRDATAKVKPMKVPKYIPVVLTRDEVKAILSSFDLSAYTGARNHALVFTLLDCGLRVAEVSGLRMADVDADKGTGKVMGKGRKERIFPIGADLRKELRRFLRMRTHYFRERETDEGFFFASERGCQLGTSAIEHMLKKAAFAAGVDPKRVTPHNFRRTCATWLLESGASVFHVQSLLGHEDLATTRRYVNLSLDGLKESHAKASPLSRLKGDGKK